MIGGYHIPPAADRDTVPLEVLSAILSSGDSSRLVRRLVVVSSPYAKSGWYPETQEGMSHVGAAMAVNMMQTPTGKFSKQWPEPQRFPQFLDKMGNMMS